MRNKEDWLQHFNAMSMLELAELWEENLEAIHPAWPTTGFNNFRLEHDVMAEELAELMSKQT